MRMDLSMPMWDRQSTLLRDWPNTLLGINILIYQLKSMGYIHLIISMVGVLGFSMFLNQN